MDGNVIKVEPYCYRGGDRRFNGDVKLNPLKAKNFEFKGFKIILTSNSINIDTKWQDIKDWTLKNNIKARFVDIKISDTYAVIIIILALYIYLYLIFIYIYLYFI